MNRPDNCESENDSEEVITIETVYRINESVIIENKEIVEIVNYLTPLYNIFPNE